MSDRGKTPYDLQSYFPYWGRLGDGELPRINRGCMATATLNPKRGAAPYSSQCAKTEPYRAVPFDPELLPSRLALCAVGWKPQDEEDSLASSLGGAPSATTTAVVARSGA